MNRITKALLIPVLLLIACGGAQSLPDINATVEATALSIPTVAPAPTVTPIPIATSTPVPPTVTPAEDEIKEDVVCTLSGGEIVQKGWSGKDTAANYCNQCMCLNAGLACTKMACPAVKSPATPTPVPATANSTTTPTH